MKLRVAALAAVTLLAATLPVALLPAQASPLRVDRAVVRFSAPETGGARSPRFVFERELAFEARLEALADPERSGKDERPYRDRHLRAALERHIAETLLASARIDPEPSVGQMNRQAELARLVLVQRVGGKAALDAAARAEGLADREVLRVARRQARASLYLDRMVAPMLSPSEAELRSVHRTVATPFRGLPFPRVAGALRRWYVGRRLAQALASYYENARSRITVTLLD